MLFDLSSSNTDESADKHIDGYIRNNHILLIQLIQKPSLLYLSPHHFMTDSYKYHFRFLSPGLRLRDLLLLFYYNCKAISFRSLYISNCFSLKYSSTCFRLISTLYLRELSPKIITSPCYRVTGFIVSILVVDCPLMSVVPWEDPKSTSITLTSVP